MKTSKARKAGNTLFKDGNRELNLVFDFAGADAQEILNLAAETLVIRFRVATKAKTAASFAAWQKSLHEIDWVKEDQAGITVNVAKWLRPKPATIPLLASSFKSCKNLEEIEQVKSQLLALALPATEIKKAIDYHVFYILEPTEPTEPTETPEPTEPTEPETPETTN